MLRLISQGNKSKDEYSLYKPLGVHYVRTLQRVEHVDVFATKLKDKRNDSLLIK